MNYCEKIKLFNKGALAWVFGNSETATATERRIVALLLAPDKALILSGALCTLLLGCFGQKGSEPTGTRPIRLRKISSSVWSNFPWIFCWTVALGPQVQIRFEGCWWKTCWDFWSMRERWGSQGCSSASCCWLLSLERPCSWYNCGRTPEYSHWARLRLPKSTWLPCECEESFEYRLWSCVAVVSRGRPSLCAARIGS